MADIETLKHLRVGTGFDIHPLVEGGPLMLGCTALPVDTHLKGHSDGDCAAHAVADALLSAGLSLDLGMVFPTDSNNLDRPGCSILMHTASLLRDADCHVLNIDLSIICDHPTLAPYLDDMRVAMAACLGISSNAMMVKARHVEGLAFRENSGIAALSSVLVMRADGG